MSIPYSGGSHDSRHSPNMMRSVLFIPLAAALAASPLLLAPAFARDRAPMDQSQIPAPGKTISLIVYGDDPCPKADGDDIVVCGRRPEKERYRIPPKLRETKEDVGSQGWGSRAAAIDTDGRQFIPGSCNAVGSFGASGCTQAMLRQWFAERRMTQQADRDIP